MKGNVKIYITKCGRVSATVQDMTQSPYNNVVAGLLNSGGGCLRVHVQTHTYALPEVPTNLKRLAHTHTHSASVRGKLRLKKHVLLFHTRCAIYYSSEFE